MNYFEESVEEKPTTVHSLIDENDNIRPLKEEPPTLDAFANMKSLFTGHTDAVRAIAVDLAASRIYTASWDETVGVWNLPTRALIGVLPHGSWVNAVVLVQGKHVGKVVVSGAEDGNISFWSVNDLLIVHQIMPGSGPITLLTTLKDNVFAASLNNVYCLSASTGSVIREYREQVDVTSIVAHEEFLYCGLEDGRILCKEIVGGFILRELQGHKGPVKALHVSGPTNTLCSGADDGLVKLWAMSTGLESETLSIHTKPIYALAMHLRGGDRFLYSGSSDGTVKCTRLGMNQTAVLMGTPPYCIALIGGKDSGHKKHSVPFLGSPLSAGAESPTSPAAHFGLSSFDTSLGGSSSTQEALVVVGDFSGRVELKKVEKFEDNLKFLPPPRKQG